MIRRALLVLVAVAVGLVVLPSTPGGTVEQPNIVVLVLDDADRRLLLTAPHINSIVGDRGADFPWFYATQSQCCPARASLWTGEYVHNHGIRANTAKRGGGYAGFRESHEDRSIVRVMKEQGYQTGYFGKYFNRYGPTTDTELHVPPHWDRWTGLFVTDEGEVFPRYDYRFNMDGQIESRGNHPAVYVDRVVGSHARRWLGHVLTRPDPVFAVVSPLGVHGHLRDDTDPPAYANAFGGAAPPALQHESFDEADVSDKPAYIRSLPRIGSGKRAAIIDRYRHRLRQLHEIDDLLERLRTTIRNRGELGNTYLIVTSDNGWMQGQHRLPLAKLVPYDESVRMPLLVRGPGVVPRKVPGVATFADLYATLGDIAGVADPDLRDGRSLLPALRGGEIERDAVLIENLMDNSVQAPNFAALVTRRWKFVDYDTGEQELYALQKDPREVDNRADRRPDKVEELSSWLEELRTCEGDTCRTADRR